MTGRNAAASLRARYQAQTRAILKHLAGLPEVAMRIATFGDELSKRGAIEAVWILEILIRGVLRHDRESQILYAGLVAPERLMGRMDEGRLDAMLSAGRDERCIAAVQWLLSPIARTSEQAVEAEILVDKNLRDMPLGSRRALARRARGENINRLVKDPDAGVVANLLNNPYVLEATVLKICSSRPTVSAALEAVLRSPRWGHRYRIRWALVKNPYLAQKIAVNLLPLLTRRDLKSVRDDESLTSTLRLAAQRLLDL